MFELKHRPEMASRLYKGVLELASDKDGNSDVVQVMQHVAGILLETYMVFEKPDQTMEASFHQLAQLLGCEPEDGPLPYNVFPPANVIDFQTERGRLAARVFFEDWLDCEFQFHDLMLVIIHNIMVHWEENGIPRAQSFRFLVEFAQSAMAFEVAAQELCDIVIERKVSFEGWSLGDCIASLSAVSGRKLALSLSFSVCENFYGRNLPESLDQVVHVMTQEAVRLGVPAGGDWRTGLVANDVPIDPPTDLIAGIEPYCDTFFDVIGLDCEQKQSVSCAKAAGRMVAVAAGGEFPEMEPAIAKPLAMAAITESYKSICMAFVSAQL